MTTFDAHYEGQADGDDITVANSDDFGDSACVTPVTNGGSIQFTGTTPLRGLKSLLFTPPSGSTIYLPYTDSADHVTGALRFNFRLTGYPSATCDFPWRIVNSSGATLISAQMTSTGLLRLSAGSSAQMTTAVPLNTSCRIEAQYSTITSGTGTVNMQFFNTLSGASAADSIGLTSLGLATQARGIRIGKILAAPTLAAFRVDDVKWVTGNATAIGPYVVPPVAVAGNDQIGVEAFKTVTVVGTDQDDDGTVVTRTWRVVSTTNGVSAPTLSGTGTTRTFKAPGTLTGTDIVLGYKVTDNDALDSLEDTMTVSVFPAAERAIMGGVQVPMEVQAIV